MSNKFTDHFWWRHIFTVETMPLFQIPFEIIICHDDDDAHDVRGMLDFQPNERGKLMNTIDFVVILLSMFEDFIKFQKIIMRFDGIQMKITPR